MKRGISLELTHGQRKVLAQLLPTLAKRLAVDATASRAISFTLKEIREIANQCEAALSQAKGGLRNSLRRVMEAANQRLEEHQGSNIDEIPVAERIYQFKITLLGTRLPIWRRIQTQDCTLDKLHEQIQTAMGWTNSHLHQFDIGGVRYGDPQLLHGDWMDEEQLVNSLQTQVSQIIPADGKRFSFSYEYDFGDGWEHEILFEGCYRAEKGTRYPLCLGGARACPPEDVGGIWGYEAYLEAIADPEHEEHESYLEWGGPFDPEEFDAKAATRDMRKGLSNWREML